MRTARIRAIVLAAACIGWAATGGAWVTNIGAGAHGAWTGPGDFYIGSNTSDNAINLFEGGTFRTTEPTYLGYDSGANSNAVTIDGAGSVWTNTAWHFRIGESGDYNSMTITDGGRFHGNVGSALYLGWNADSRYNSLVINGEGSSAQVQYDLYVGYSGSANYFELSEGGTFIATREFGMGQNINSSYNTGLVTGAGSKLTAAGERQFYIGRDASSHNQLTVSDEGEVLSRNHLYVGHGGGTGNVLRVLTGGHVEVHTNLFVGTGTGAASNILHIGDGTVTIGANVFVGNNASSRDNLVAVTNGGGMLVDGLIQVGGHATASGNRLLVEGTGSWVTNVGTFNIGTGSNNQVIVRDGGSLYSGDGTLTIGGGATDSGNRLLVEGTGSWVTNVGQTIISHGTGNQLVVRDSGTVTISSNVFVGNAASSRDNLVAVTNGGSMLVEGLIQVGGSATASGHSLLVEGAGSWVTNVGRTIISHGTNNQLTVRDGGRFSSLADYVFIGQSGSVGAQAMVEGTGSVLYGSGILDVGQSSAGTRLVVTNGGNVDVNRLRSITWGATTDDGTHIHVTGEGSTVTARSMVAVGLFNSVNHLMRIDEGAQLTSGSGDDYIGGWWNNTASNRLEVADAGSAFYSGGNLFMGIAEGDSHHRIAVSNGALFAVGNQLRIGETGSWNRVEVSNGGMVHVDSTTSIGRVSESEQNEVLVTGTGTAWTNIGTILLHGGAHNRLIIADGGRLFSSNYLSVGHTASAYANLVHIHSGGTGIFDNIYHGYDEGVGHHRMIIEGEGSSLLATNPESDLLFGRFGSGNYLEVSDGGQLRSDRYAVIGFDARATYNTGLVTGVGSVWSTAAGAGEVYDFYVGRAGSHNELYVENGGLVEADSRFNIGYSPSACSNLLHIRDGGEVRIKGSQATIGWAVDNTANDNRLIVEGSGSWMEAQGNFFMRGGTNNQLEVKDGARMEVWGGMDVGVLEAARDHSVEVSGGGLLAVSNQFRLGEAASGGRATISTGGMLETGAAIIGEEASAGDNQVLLTGAGSSWTNHGTIFVGYGGAVGNQLQVHDGALLESGAIDVRAGGILELSNVTVYVKAESNPFVLQDGGLLRGTGTIAAEDFMNPPDDPFFIDGTVSPGFSTGTLEFGGDLALGANAVVVMEIAGEEDFDQLIVFDPWATGVYGNLTFNGTLQLSLLGGYEPQLHDSFQLFVADSYLDIENMLIDDSDAQLSEGWMSWQLNPDGSVSVIPEAATTGSMLLGLALIAALRRRLRT